MSTLINIQQFGFNVAKLGRKVRESADPFHTAYVNADAEGQAQLRREWMLGHLEGQGIADAQRVLTKGKGAGAKLSHIQAIDRASSDFRYNVVRPVKAKVNKTEAVRVSRVQRDAAMTFLSQFDGESLDAQIKAAMAVLRSLA